MVQLILIGLVVWVVWITLRKYSEDINSKHIKQYPKYIPKLIKSFKVSQHFGGFFFIIRTANLIKQSHPQFSFSNQLYSSSSGVVLL